MGLKSTSQQKRTRLTPIRKKKRKTLLGLGMRGSLPGGQNSERSGRNGLGESSKRLSQTPTFKKSLISGEAVKGRGSS